MKSLNVYELSDYNQSIMGHMHLVRNLEYRASVVSSSGYVPVEFLQDLKLFHPRKRHSTT